MVSVQVANGMPGQPQPVASIPASTAVFSLVVANDPTLGVTVAINGTASGVPELYVWSGNALGGPAADAVLTSMDASGDNWLGFVLPGFVASGTPCNSCGSGPITAAVTDNTDVYWKPVYATTVGDPSFYDLSQLVAPGTQVPGGTAVALEWTATGPGTAAVGTAGYSALELCSTPNCAPGTTQAFVNDAASSAQYVPAVPGMDVALGINDFGLVVGTSGAFAVTSQYMVNDTLFPSVQLGVPDGSTASTPTGVNNNGQISGTVIEADGKPHAVVWPAVTEPAIDLSAYAPSGADFTAATGIDAAGDIVVTGTLNGAPAAFLVAAKDYQ